MESQEQTNSSQDRHRHRHMELARAYVPVQHYTDKYPLDTALNRGTLFPDLWRPYRKKRRR